LDPFKVITGSMVVDSRLFGPATFNTDRATAHPRGRDPFSQETAASTSSISCIAVFASIAFAYTA